MLPRPGRRKKRSPAIVIASWFILLSALANIAIGALVLGTSLPALQGGEVIVFSTPDEGLVVTETGENLWVGVTYAALGAVQLVIGVAFWQMRSWAWVGAMSWQALKLLLELGNFFLGEVSPVTLGFSILLVFLLNQSDLRRAFGILRSNHEAPTNPSLRASDVN